MTLDGNSSNGSAPASLTINTATVNMTGTNKYAVATRSPQRDSALVSAGLDFVLGPRTVLATDFAAQSGGITKFLSDWRVGVAVKF